MVGGSLLRDKQHTTFSVMKKFTFFPIILCLFIAVTGCNHTLSGRTKEPGHHGKKTAKRGTQRPYVIGGRTYYPVPTAQGYSEKGIASWYGKPFHGRKTANGETYNMYGHTAAHKTLPMNTMLLVKNLTNGKSTVVRINDRGPFVRNRIIDLTKTAADELDLLNRGTAQVEIIALAEELKETVSRKRPVPGSEKKTAKNKTASKRNTPTPKVATQAPEQPKKLVYQDFDKGNFYIQVGAFEYRTNARSLAKKFAAKGKDVIIQQFPAAGIRLYRVLVYSGTSLKRARRDESFLEHTGYPNALVIARDKK